MKSMGFLKLVVKQMIFTVAAIIVSAVIIYFFKAKIENSAENIREKHSLLAALDKQSENFFILKTNSSVLEKNLPILKRALPKEREITDIVNSLEFLATQTNNISNLNFEPIGVAENSNTAKIVNFSANLSGNMGAFAQYLKGLKKLPYFIEISDITVSSDSDIYNNNSRMMIKAKVYIKN